MVVVTLTGFPIYTTEEANSDLAVKRSRSTNVYLLNNL